MRDLLTRCVVIVDAVGLVDKKRPPPVKSPKKAMREVPSLLPPVMFPEPERSLMMVEPMPALVRVRFAEPS